MPKKKQKVYVTESKQGKGRPKLLPLVRELLTAVALTVLKAKVKAWILALFVKRQRAAPEGAPLRRVSSQSAPQAPEDRPPAPENKTEVGKLRAGKAFPAQVLGLLKNTASKWVQDKCPQPGGGPGLLHRLFLSAAGAGAVGRLRPDLWGQ